MDVAVIADIVGSRRLPDRSEAQRTFERVVAQAEFDLPLAVEPLQATAGDELQGRYATLDAALASLLLVQLALPAGHELRFGIGVGAIRAIDGGGSGAAPRLQDGPAWWAARAAIDTVHARQQRAVPTSRIWIVGAPEEDARMHTTIDVANAYALARDELVMRMSPRERRLVYGRSLGRTQAELAGDEGISQSAVSQALASAGAASVVLGFEALQGRARS
ncbi:SatD family protein [Microbacterium sp. ASV81]|uniref:SatD family protein n=1 Tax=Microbacterium capsulatum TaxID=3041921 RepID=A0ABU0XL38_9MICO|nr:SatD family protein [Microbacterium sp. ASV81]MDQ4215867.1 SatD family protein [Microbacterium sp. ASV81]